LVGRNTGVQEKLKNLGTKRLHPNSEAVCFTDRQGKEAGSGK
jgi:hypothetical protein